MARARKRDIQQSLPGLDKNGQRRGGKRPGAGRPPKGPRSSERHKRREALKKNEAAHVVLRAADDVGQLRRPEIYEALREALVTSFTREDFRIVHISVQGSHVHMLVEADDRLALARGMKAFGISAAKHINAVLPLVDGDRRRGTVFPDRYHVQIIRTPRHARQAIASVLNNWREHGENRAASAKDWLVDPFSSAPSFDGWRDIDVKTIEWPESYEPLPVWQPKTVLLRDGWRKHGLIDSREVRKATTRAFALAE